MALATYNNPKIDPREYLEAWSKVDGVVFVTGQLEKGAEGTPHIQYFVQTKSQKRLGFFTGHCGHSHFELVKHDNGCEPYVNKEDTRVDGPWTFGIRPARLNKKGDLARRNQELIEKGPEQAVKDGDIALINYVKVKNAIDEFLNNTKKPEHLTGSLQDHNLWITGPPGIGKTKYVIDKYPDYFDKDKSKWWNGYTGQDVVLIDDLEIDEKFMLGNLKRWCQHKPFMLDNKFGTLKLIRPKRIIVTSNFTIDEIWDREVDRKALARRFKVHIMDDPFNVLKETERSELS